MNSTSSLLKRLQYLFNRHILGRQYLTAYSAPYHTYFKFSIKDGIGKDIYYKWGVYSEDFITRFILDQVGVADSDFIIDIGANIGWYSLTLSSKSQPTMISFEPDPTNYALLNENISLNKRTNIHPFNCAVANAEGVMKLYLYKKYNQGRHSLIEGPKTKEYVEVKTIVLDKFLEEKGWAGKRIKLLKIDIEGFEFPALRGAAKTLARTDYVLSEFSPAIMEKINESPLNFIEFMESFGFRGYELLENRIQKADFNKILAKKNEVNDIFWKRE